MGFSRLGVGRLLGFILMMQLVGHLHGTNNQCLPFCKQQDFSGVTYQEISALLARLFQYNCGNNFGYFIPLCSNVGAIDCSPAKDNDLRLELLLVLSRHGDRLPEEYEVYPKDPEKNTGNYEKVRYGQLTEAGKQRMKKFGQLLKKYYEWFLGDYSPEKVHAYSSDFPRTKNSLENTLSGLYPSKSNSLVINTEPKDKSFLTKFRFGECEPKFYKLVEDTMKKPEVGGKLVKYKELLDNLSNHTGLDLTKDTAKKALELYHNIKGGMSQNLTRPAWLTDEILKKLEAFLAESLDGIFTSEKVRRITAGPVVKQFLSNLENNGTKKLYVYSGHDINLGTFTRAHNFTGVPGVPDFGSSVVVEKLRGKDGRIVVKMFYWNGADEKVIPLKFEGVRYEMPLDTYKKNVEKLFPHADDCA